MKAIKGINLHITNLVGAPYITSSMNMSLKYVKGKMWDSMRGSENIAIVGNVIPENVNAMTAYPPPRERPRRRLDVMLIMNMATD